MFGKDRRAFGPMLTQSGLGIDGEVISTLLPLIFASACCLAVIVLKSRGLAQSSHQDSQRLFPFMMAAVGSSMDGMVAV
jgi:hypothetical protein